VRASSFVALACGAALLAAGGWWLLGPESAGSQGASVGSVLSGPDRTEPSAAQVPRYTPTTPPEAAAPIALNEPAPAATAASDAPPTQAVPMLRGRVVSGAGSSAATPVPGALIDGFLAVKSNRRTLNLACDAGGRFEIPLLPRELALKSGELTFTHPEGLGRCLRKITAEDVAAGGDLGDIELLAARRVHVLVLDAGSQPVPGALAVAGDDTDVRSGRTDKQGRAMLPCVLLETPSISVWAHRYFGTTVALPAADVVIDEQHPLVAVMQRCPSLDIVVTDAAGVPQPELLAVLNAQQELFGDLDTSDLHPGIRAFAPDPMLAEVGAAPLGAATWKTGFTDGAATMSGSLNFGLDADGRASISDLLPGVPFTLSVEDSTGGVAWGPEPLTLQPGEAREVRAVLAHAAVDLVVRVTDPQGTPLDHAHVEVVWVGKDSSSTPSTNAKGLVTLRRVYADAVTLAVDKPGYVTRRLHGVVVARGGQPFEVVLEPGAVVHVVVHDAYGRPVQAETVRAMLAGELVGQAVLDTSGTAAEAADGSAAGSVTAGAHQAQSARSAAQSGLEPPPPQDRSRWLLTDLPRDELVIEVLLGGRTISQPHDGRVPEAELIVPSVGALRVSFAFELDQSLQHVLQVRPSDASSGATRSPLLSPWERSVGEVLLPTLFPGDYEVTLSQWEPTKVAPCSGTSLVHVAEGATASVVLTAP